MKENVGWLLAGFFLCSILVFCSALKKWESVFDKFGPLMFKAVIRTQVEEFNRNRDWHSRPRITASNFYGEVMGYIEQWENE